MRHQQSCVQAFRGNIATRRLVCRLRSRERDRMRILASLIGRPIGATAGGQIGSRLDVGGLIGNILQASAVLRRLALSGFLRFVIQPL